MWLQMPCPGSMMLKLKLWLDTNFLFVSFWCGGVTSGCKLLLGYGVACV